MTPFDIVSARLDGINLIEASAGTGKTYVISRLVVRLLLEQELPIEQILVVTFTEAATAELRDRVLSAVRIARNLLDGDDTGMDDDDPLRRICCSQTDPIRAIETLSVALRSFDDAAIHTIHGFCYRVLRENAFETSSLFDVQLITDQAELIQEISDDYWRRQSDGFSVLFLRYLMGGSNRNLAPDDLAELAQRHVGRPLSSISPDPTDAPSDLGPLEERFQQSFDVVHNLWAESGRNEARRFLVGNQGLYANYSKGVLQSLAEADSYLEGTAHPDPNAAFIRLSARKIPIKKDYSHLTVPPIFDAIERLCDLAAELASAYKVKINVLRAACLREVRRRLPERKTELGVNYYDDLLTELEQALFSSAGSMLARVIRRRFPAALIDEFQDTDPVQFRILSRVYRREGTLFLIGDPKQAIYSFRGADVYAYLQAVQQADRRYTLGVNHRSTETLVVAQNTLFRARANPFREEQIQYYPVSAGRKDAGIPGALEFWMVPRDDPGGKAITKEVARERIGLAVASAVIELLRSGTDADSIAILVRKNRQATELQQILARRGVPSVLYTAETLFTTEQAAELERFMAGVLDPGRESNIRSALSCELIGLSGEEIQQAEADTDLWQSHVEQLGRYNTTWAREGFFPMFQAVLRARRDDGQTTRAHLLSLQAGRRKLTNYLHLAETLHQASLERRMAMETLLKWLQDRRVRPADGDERNLLRMETDEKAVRIVTIHMSKGQEWPVVICPHLWDVIGESGREILYHDQDGGLHLDLTSDKELKGLSEEEALAENLRLLYVALTRARDRCMVAWGFVSAAEKSALAYLLHPDPTGQVASSLKTMDDGAILKRLGLLAESSGGTIVVRMLDESEPQPYQAQRADTAGLTARRLDRAVETGYRMTSFTALTRTAGGWLDPDRDGADRGAPFSGEAGDGIGAAAETADRFIDFPRGARAGTLLHALLEETAFEIRGSGPELAEEKLGEHGFDVNWAPVLSDLLETVAVSPLGHSAVRLDTTGREQTLREVGFTFPLTGVNGPTLAGLFSGRNSADGDHDRMTAEMLSRLDRRKIHGYLRGYIDMVLFCDSRYWIVDWKSNYLGDEAEDYGEERLAATMTEELYRLQAGLYSLALDRYLATRVRDYDYQRDFGGVLYVFLRGLSLDPTVGVFELRPGLEQIGRYRETLLP